MNKFLSFLQAVMGIIYKKPLPELECNKLMPRGTYGVPRWAKSFTYYTFSGRAMAQFVEANAKDLPPVAITLGEVAKKLWDIGDSFSYGWRELEGAANGGVNLSEAMGVEARNGILNKIDDVAINGDSLRGIDGFINNSNITTTTSAALLNDASAHTSGVPNTGDDWVALIRAIFNAFKATGYKPDTLAMPSNIAGKFSDGRMGANLETRIEEYVKKCFPTIKEIVYVDCLNGAGASASDRIVAYTKSEDFLMNVVPVEFEMLDPQASGLGTTINCPAVTGGCCIFRPTGFLYVDLKS